MRKLFLLLVLSMSVVGCRHYRHAISVSVDAPIMTQVTNGQHTTLKVEYRFEEPSTPPSQ